MDLCGHLTARVAAAFEAAGFDPSHGRVVPTQPGRQKAIGNDFQCNGAMPAAKRAGRKPMEVAEALVQWLAADPAMTALVSSLEAASPGFLNFRVRNEFLSEHTQRIAAHPLWNAAEAEAEAPQTILLDFGGPNVAKSMHVGHLRSTLIGDCLQRVLRYVGHDVTSDVHLGDWGTQMGKVLVEIFRRGLSKAEIAALTITDLDALYREGNQRCESDPAVDAAAREATVKLQIGEDPYHETWRVIAHTSYLACQQVFDRLGVQFTTWGAESDVQGDAELLIQDGLQRGWITESFGALAIPLPQPEWPKDIAAFLDVGTAQGWIVKHPVGILTIPRATLPSDAEALVQEGIAKGWVVEHEGEWWVPPYRPPFLMRKSDGAFLYSTTDFATLIDRYGKGFARVLYVVDHRQSLHFEALFDAFTVWATAQGASTTRLGEHIQFGTMNGPGGKPFKTREGQNKRLVDLLDEAAAAARGRLSADADPEAAEWIAQAAIKYADLNRDRKSNYAFEVDAFLAKEGNTGVYQLYTVARCRSVLRKARDLGVTAGRVVITTDEEREVALALDGFAAALARTVATCEPHHLCQHVYRVAMAFNQLYNAEGAILESPSRLDLTAMVEVHLTTVLGLLGIQTVDRL